MGYFNKNGGEIFGRICVLFNVAALEFQILSFLNAIKRLFCTPAFSRSANKDFLSFYVQTKPLILVNVRASKYGNGRINMNKRYGCRGEGGWVRWTGMGKGFRKAEERVNFIRIN